MRYGLGFGDLHYLRYAFEYAESADEHHASHRAAHSIVGRAEAEINTVGWAHPSPTPFANAKHGARGPIELAILSLAGSRAPFLFHGMLTVCQPVSYGRRPPRLNWSHIAEMQQPVRPRHYQLG